MYIYIYIVKKYKLYTYTYNHLNKHIKSCAVNVSRSSQAIARWPAPRCWWPPSKWWGHPETSRLVLRIEWLDRNSDVELDRKPENVEKTIRKIETQFLFTKHTAEAIKKKELQRSMDHSAGSSCLWTIDKLWFTCLIKWWFAIATLNSQRVIPNKWMVSSFNRTILCKWEDFPLPSSKKTKWCKWN